MRRNVFAPIALMTLLPAVASAADLSVSASSGDDSATYAEVSAGTASWQTIGRAAWGSTDRSSPNTAEAAQPGDTVIVEAGTYAAASTSGERYIPAWNPANGASSSSEADRITFRADGDVYLQGTGGEGGPIIGAYQRNYITWDGFIIDEQYVDSRPDTGPVVLWDNEYGELLNLTIIGDPDPLVNYTSWDNHNGIRLEAARYGTIRGCTIRGFNHGGTGEPTRNAAGIMMYVSPHTTIEHNEITGNCTGIYVKGSADPDQEALVVRYNLIWGNTQRGMEILGVEGQPNAIYQNVFRDNPTGIQIIGMDGPVPQNVDIVNNTFDDNDQALMWGATVSQFAAGMRYYNNVITSSDTAYAHEDGDTSETDSEHNCFFDNAELAQIAYQTTTFSEWTSQTGEDLEAPASVVQDPLYVDGPGDDFRLQSGSPCEALGVDILDLDGDSATDDNVPAGAYITGNETIGPGENGGTGGSGGTGQGGSATGGSGTGATGT
ncbi:MAG: right-handed parallel beta-helix repeat-containing protein, partial [Deltaproteobacteria bacterium]|nr:right-handed parallel beta-helix repeat-containing protein [Deltaproteobacteria bacterium]MBW2536214.1 right-handed parallel beta-helix repeat-containing protein [Deltaproteobacteria bacterium]